MSSPRSLDQRALRDYTESLRHWLGHAREEKAAGDGDPNEAALWDRVQSAVEELAVSEEELRVSNEELQGVQQELAQERARYVDLFESAPDGYIVTDRAGIIRQANRSAGELFGVRPDFLEGKPLLLYLSSSDRKRMWTELEPLMVRDAKPERALQWQVLLEPRAGGRRNVEVSVAAQSNELRWLLRDVSERVAAELAKQQLRIEAARRAAIETAEHDARFLAQAAESLAVADVQTLPQRVVDVAAAMLTDFAVLLQDDDGVVVCAASAGLKAPFPRTLGRWSDGDLVGRAYLRRTPEVVAGAIAAAELPESLVEWSRAEDVSSLMALPLLAGRNSYGVLLVGNVGNQVSCGARLLIARNFADRVALAYQMAQLLRDAQQANEAKSAFLAIVSHELRTPLTSVIGYAELLAMETHGILNQRQRTFLDRLESSARHLVQLVDQVLLFTRVDGRQEAPHLQPVNVNALVRDVTALFEAAAQARGLELRAEIDDTPMTIETDADKLRQVLINLLANAVKFTDQGWVCVRIADAGDDVLIEVGDSGIGFDEGEAAAIFEPFRQIDQADTRRAGGVGLGLAVSQRLVQELGGAIQAASKPGCGSTFTVRLPRRSRATAAREKTSLFW